MKTKLLSIVLLTSVIFLSCGISQEEYSKIKTENDSLKSEIEKLNAELDEFRFGENRTVAIVEKAYSENDFSTARENIKILREKHPESPKNIEFEKLLLTIERKEKEEQRRKEVEEKERIRLENLNNTGIWTIRYYVDDFGEPTKEGYITTSNVIKGLFSNIATQNSQLNVGL